MHTLPRNSAEHTLFLFFASFRKSKSALCHLLCEATCSLRTDKQLRNNVTSVDEYSTIVTVQQLGDRIMHIMHISSLKYNRDFKIRDATASRTRRLIKDWDENAVVCAGKVKLRSPSRYKTPPLRIGFISVIPRQLFRRSSHGIF